MQRLSQSTTVSLALVLGALAAVFGGWTSESLAQRAVLRKLDFSWDEVQGARGYDLELAPTKAGKPKQFKTDKTSWSGELEPGSYKLRVRALDRRGVPGTWSDAFPVALPYPAPKALAPAPSAVIKAVDADKTRVSFRWQSLGEGVAYKIKVEDEKGQARLERDARDAQAEIELPVATRYTWSVRAYADGQAGDELKAPVAFLLEGPALASPTLARPFEATSRTLAWVKPAHAESYVVKVQVKKKAATRWATLSQESDFADDALALDPAWPEGRYRITVAARAPLRATSKPAVFDFEYGTTQTKTQAKPSLADGPGRLDYAYIPFIADNTVRSASMTDDVRAVVFDSNRLQASYRTSGRTHAVGARMSGHLATWTLFGKEAASQAPSQDEVEVRTLAMSSDLFYRWTVGNLDLTLGAGYGAWSAVLLYAIPPDKVGVTRGAVTEGRGTLTLGTRLGRVNVEAHLLVGAPTGLEPVTLQAAQHAGFHLALAHPVLLPSLRMTYLLGIERMSLTYLGSATGETVDTSSRLAQMGVGVAWVF